MRESLSFFVPGAPVPKGSARAFRNATTGSVVVWASNREKLRPFERRVSYAARAAGARPLECPVRIHLEFLLERPAVHMGTGRNAGLPRPSAPPLPAVKPDLDKLIRAILDGLSKVAIVDDAQVVEIHAAKVYANSPAEVGVRVEIAQAGLARPRKSKARTRRTAA